MEPSTNIFLLPLLASMFPLRKLLDPRKHTAQILLRHPYCPCYESNICPWSQHSTLCCRKQSLCTESSGILNTCKVFKNAQAHTLFQVSLWLYKNYRFIRMRNENYGWTLALIYAIGLSPPIIQSSLGRLWSHLSQSCCSQYHLRMHSEIRHSSAERLPQHLVSRW